MQFGESPYVYSPFRLLGLYASASCSEIEQVLQSRYQQGGAGAFETAADNGQAVDLPWLRFAEVSSERRRQAVESLLDYEQRWAARLFWFHCSDEVDSQALKLIAQGDFERAHVLWRENWNQFKARTSYLHNLAVLHHSRMLASPRGASLLICDIKDSAFCWEALLAGRSRYLAKVMLDGEDSPAADVIAQAEQLAWREGCRINEELTRTILGMLRQVNGIRQVRLVQFSVPVSYLGGEVYDNQRAKNNVQYRWAVERAEECARRRDAAGVEGALEEARSLCPRTGMEKHLNETAQRLRLEMLRHGMIPVARQPHLMERSGMGVSLINAGKIDPLTRSYEADLVFRFAYIPLWYLGRYRVAQDYDERLKFLGKFPHGPRFMIWNGLVLLAVVALIISMAHMNSPAVDSGSRFMLADFDNTAVVIPLQELQSMKDSESARREVREKAESSLKQLREEEKDLQERLIPELKAHVGAVSMNGADDPMDDQVPQEILDEKNKLIKKDNRAGLNVTVESMPTGGNVMLEEAQNRLKGARADLKDIQKNIEATESLIKYIDGLEAGKNG